MLLLPQADNIYPKKAEAFSDHPIVRAVDSFEKRLVGAGDRLLL